MSGVDVLCYSSGICIIRFLMLTPLFPDVYLHSYGSSPFRCTDRVTHGCRGLTDSDLIIYTSRFTLGSLRVSLPCTHKPTHTHLSVLQICLTQLSPLLFLSSLESLVSLDASSARYVYCFHSRMRHSSASSCLTHRDMYVYCDRQALLYPKRTCTWKCPEIEA